MASVEIAKSYTIGVTEEELMLLAACVDFPDHGSQGDLESRLRKLYEELIEFLPFSFTTNAASVFLSSEASFIKE